VTGVEEDEHDVEGHEVEEAILKARRRPAADPLSPDAQLAPEVGDLRSREELLEGNAT
jgi:hypothetical protein